MKFFKSKITIILIGIFCVFIIFIVGKRMFNGDSTTPQVVGTREKLDSIYNDPGEYLLYNILYTFCFPFNRDGIYKYPGYLEYEKNDYKPESGIAYYNLKEFKADNTSNDNMVVEFIDEPEVDKYDGKCIYSFSDNNIYIFEADGILKGDLISNISVEENYTPKALLLYKDKLVVVLNKISKISSSSFREKDILGTKIIIYDITDRYNPIEEKNIETTSKDFYLKIINGNLYYVFCDKICKNSNNELELQYVEDGIEKEVDLNNAYYFDNYTISRFFTTVAHLNLDSDNLSFDTITYLSNTTKVYITDYNIYLLYEKYDPNFLYSDLRYSISRLFSLEGANDGIYSDSYNTNNETYAIKLVIDNKGNIKFEDNEKFNGESTIENLKMNLDEEV